MNNEIIPRNYFLSNDKHIVKFVPEEKIEEEPWDNKLWSRLFVYTKNMNKLRLTNIGKYSISKPLISEGLLKLVKFLWEKFLRKVIPRIENVVITETNGGVGGFSIKLMDVFSNINIVEIIPEHYDIIRNNLEVYWGNLDNYNIKIYKNDYLDILYDLNQDVIICDPPWGGLDYKKNLSIRLGLNNINIIHIINRLYTNKKFYIFILFVPYNYDIQQLITGLICKHIYIDIPVINQSNPARNKHYFISIINLNYISQTRNGKGSHSGNDNGNRGRGNGRDNENGNGYGNSSRNDSNGNSNRSKGNSYGNGNSNRSKGNSNRSKGKKVYSSSSTRTHKIKK
jgi:hypothetical protein